MSVNSGNGVQEQGLSSRDKERSFLMKACANEELLLCDINSLWRRKSWSTLVQMMARSHCLDDCWLTMSEIL